MEIMIKEQIRPSVFNLPFISLPLSLILLNKKLRMYITIGLLVSFINPAASLSALKISSKKGISMPIETMENAMERIIKRK